MCSVPFAITIGSGGSAGREGPTAQIAAAVAYAVTGAIEGWSPLFILPSETFGSSSDLVWYGVLGIFAGLVAALLPAVFYGVRDQFHRLRIPNHFKPAIGGLLVGGISLAWKRVVSKTGIQGLTFHDLHHEAISRLFEDTDLDVIEIRAISGHKTLQMLVRYTHRLADRLAGMRRVAQP